MSRIRLEANPSASVLLIIALAAGAAVTAIAVRSVPIPVGENPPAIPAIVPEGLVVSPADSVGSISSEQALEVVRDLVATPGAKVETYLVVLTDPNVPGVTDRRVWLIEVTGVQFPAYGPGLGAGAAPPVLSTAWAYVDAVTGEWLTTRIE